MNTLCQAVDDYLELRRGLGFKLVNHGACLGEFVSFLEQKKTSQITTALAVQFAMLHPQQEPKAKAGRYSVVRGFASYRVGADPATEIPPIGLVRGRSQRARPYLYSDQEVRQLLEAARHLPSTYSLRPWTYYCFFGLLAVTGMRLGEALNLQCQDIDWAEGLLTLRRTKFGKSRLVPLDASTVKVLAAFAERRNRFIAECSGRTSSHFFVTKFGTRLRDAYVYRVFWALSRQIGIRCPGTNRGPRLHDFRHRFAIETLLRWYRAGEDVAGALHLPRSCTGHRYLLVLELHTGTHGSRRETSRATLGRNPMNTPVDLSPLLEAFFTQRLIAQRKASPHTINSYRDTFSLLLKFAERRLRCQPSKLTLENLAAPFLAAFLDHLETTRANGARTRNLRLAAIHSFFRYAALEAPQHAGLIQRVLAIPRKRYSRALVDFLTRPEIEALLSVANRNTWIGRRDHAFLLTAVQTGLRLSELTSLRQQDVSLGAGAYVRCEGKGRKERCTPLAKPTATVLDVWIKHQGKDASRFLFPSTRGGRLSADAVQHLVAKHAKAAQKICPSLTKKNVSPHVLRHSAAMEMLQAGVDRSMISIWLGHESIETTQIYLDANLTIKDEILAKTDPVKSTPLRYRPGDRLLNFLSSL